MKKFLLATVASTALVSSASAADLAARAYTKAPAIAAAAYNWSGFYVGVMGGYGWSDDVTVTGVDVTGADIKGGNDRVQLPGTGQPVCVWRRS
jgi:outer membrane immunogenic protein